MVKIRRGVESAAVALLTLALSGLPGLSAAQEADAEQASSGGIEEITVTAQKREQLLQDTPIAVTAFTAEDLESFSINSSQGLGDFTPGFSISKASNTSGQMSMFGRGVGRADNHPMVDMRVGMYIDGAYSGTGNGSWFELLDIERIEILRGPQGTLFGRNTIGGAVNIITKKPTDEFGMRFKLRAGQHSQRDAIVQANIPIIPETMFARFGFARTKRDGFYDNLHPSTDDFDNDDALSASAALRWLASDSLTLDYSFALTQTDENNPLFALHSDCPEACVNGQRANTTDFKAGGGFLPFFGVTDPNVWLFLLGPNEINGRTYGEYAVDDPGDIYNDEPTFNRLQSWNHSVQIAWDLTENLTLKSISGWRKYHLAGANDLDGSPFSLFHAGQSIDHQNFLQEFQLLGTAMEGRMDFVLGANWFDQEATADNYSDQFIELIPGISNTTGTELETWALAGFGQSTYYFTDQFSFTAGLRYTAERKQGAYRGCYNDGTRSRTDLRGRDFETCMALNYPDPTADNFDANTLTEDESATQVRFSGWSPMFRAQYEWNDDVMTYLTWSRGYQAGGYNPRPSASDDRTFKPYDEEDLYTWELGIKSRWFDNRLQFNAAGYYNDGQNYQITTFLPEAATVTLVENAGRVRVRGAEVEILAAPVDSVRLMLTYSWIKAGYSEFNVPDLANPGSLLDISRTREWPHTPEHKISGQLQYAFNPQDWGSLTFTAAFVRETERTWMATAAANAHILGKPYTKFDFRADLRDAFGHEGLSLAVVGKNIADEEYKCCQGIDFGFWQGGGYGYPRQIYVELGYEFGGI